MRTTLCDARGAVVVAFVLVALVAAGCSRNRKSDESADTPAPAVAVKPDTPKPEQPGELDLTPRDKPLVRTPSPYGDTTEDTLKADVAPPSAPLRARKADTYYSLTNPRVEPRRQNVTPPPPPGSGPLLVIDYERTHERAIDGNLTLVIRSASGKDHAVQVGELRDRAGVIVLEVPNRGPWPGGVLPRDAEFYLTRGEGRYGKNFQKTFKVSNSILMGTTPFPFTLARDWTEEEKAVLAKQPVEAPKPNVNPNAGRDTQVVGSPSAFRQRFAEPGKPLLGVDWYDWFWPVQGGKEECLGPLVPIYNRDYPDMGRKRELAKPGYAVGAITAKTKTYVNGIQITFMKLTPDGKLDPNDSYTSPWLGPHQVGTKETKLGGDGRKVIGLICDQVGALNALGLVME